jgi:hypothetical protein
MLCDRSRAPFDRVATYFIPIISFHFFFFPQTLEHDLAESRRQLTESRQELDAYKQWCWQRHSAALTCACADDATDAHMQCVDDAGNDNNNDGDDDKSAAATPHMYDSTTSSTPRAAAAVMRECSICMCAPATMVFAPCGHVSTCLSCSGHVSKCPVCRREIDAKFRVFF